MEPIRILLVDDHQVVREGLRSMLQQEMDMQVVGEATNAEEALTRVGLLSPDVILMDIRMPGMGGIEGTRKLKEKYPSCNVIILTFYEDYLTQAIEAGAVGFLLKGIKREDLAMTIRAVHLQQVASFHDDSPFALVKLQPIIKPTPSTTPLFTAPIRLGYFRISQNSTPPLPM